jgi:hypothetical protein
MGLEQDEDLSINGGIFLQILVHVALRLSMNHHNLISGSWNDISFRAMYNKLEVLVL